MGQVDGRAVFEWRPYGVKLKMLPSVDTKGRIVLDIEPEVSSLDWSNALDTGVCLLYTSVNSRGNQGDSDDLRYPG